MNKVPAAKGMRLPARMAPARDCDYVNIHVEDYYRDVANVLEQPFRAKAWSRPKLPSRLGRDYK